MFRRSISRFNLLAPLSALLLLALLAACGDAASTATNTTSPITTTTDTSAGGAKLSIVSTTTQIRSMAEVVAGNLANVISILPPGADPHEYEPRPSDVQTISNSALVLRNGVGLDAWLDKIIGNAGGQRPLVDVSNGVPLRGGFEEGGDSATPELGNDPHIWFSVANAMTMTQNISNALIQVDPSHADAYKANTTAYLAKLSDLDNYIKAQIATLPADDRKIVTNHDAFGYYIDRYGLQFVGSIIPSMSTDAEPSAQDVAQLIEKIKAENVKAIFLESSINPQLAEQIGGDAKVKVVDTLYGDSLGAAGTPGATYESMMRYNTDTIVAALK